MKDDGNDITGRLENWWVPTQMFGDEVIIWGNVYDDIHDRFADGTNIHTSGVNLTTNDIEEGNVVNTRNSTYLLGKRASPVESVPADQEFMARRVAHWVDPNLLGKNGDIE